MAHICPFEWPNRDAADRDAGQKFVYLKLGLLGRYFPTYYIFPFERPNRDAANRDAGQKFVYLKLAFLDEECQLTLYFFSNDTTMTQPKQIVYLRWGWRTIWNRTVYA